MYVRVQEDTLTVVCDIVIKDDIVIAGRLNPDAI
jgi:hypothetical protein